MGPSNFLVNKNTILIDCSTIDVNTSLELQNKANFKKYRNSRCSVSGGVVGAEKGTLTFMIGGKETTFNKVKHLFEIMGSKTICVGNLVQDRLQKYAIIYY